MKKNTTPPASAESAVPAKKTARKPAARKVMEIPAEALEPAPAKKAVRKAVPEKAALAPPAASSNLVIHEATPAPLAPAKKVTVKKTSAKKAATSAGEAPSDLFTASVPAPVSIDIAIEATAPKPRAPRKTSAKAPTVKLDGASAESSPPQYQNDQLEADDGNRPTLQPRPDAAHAPSRPAFGLDPAPPADPSFQPDHYHPDQNRFGAEPDHRAASRPPGQDSALDGNHGPSYRDQPGYRPAPYPPRQQRPYPPRDPVDGPPPPLGPQGYGPPDQRPGLPPENVELGPDGLPRRLTKWERWKQRKEKFKQQKQQRYLERTGRPPLPGPNGEPGVPEGEGAERREPREPRPDFREPRPDPREPRDPRGEPRQWEPRPPRPEIPLGPPEDCCGLLEMTDKGFAFLRPKDRGFVPSPTDPFVSAELVRQHGLREGVWVDAIMQRGGRGPQVMELKKVNGQEPSAYRTLPLFEELTAINPNKRYILETEANRHTTRLIDFISPIGRGQRGLIVAPPRAGKTTFLQHIAEAVLHNYEDVKVIVLLVDERPEEVTEIARALPGAEIMASSNDQDPRNHIRMAHLAIERAKRLVEAGQHVFMLLDSITRLARGFNNSMRGGIGGKAMSGGLDSRALEIPRRLFAAARNTREAGSLTIMATALVETNNKGDDLIFQEFKGTGNMELVLDRKISQAYIYPAVDIFKSGTRREELLLPAHLLEKVHLIRRGLSGHRPQEAVERLLQIMGKYTNNNQMLVEIKARGE